jgi:hypothetical protein
MWAGRLPLSICPLLQPPSLRLFSPLLFVVVLRLSCTVMTVSRVVICCCHLGKFRSSSVLHFVADGIIIVVLQPLCLQIHGYFFFLLKQSAHCQSLQVPQACIRECVK